MERYLHFTKNFGEFVPGINAPCISRECGGLFVYRFPESNQDFYELSAAWRGRDAVEVWAETAIVNSDQPSTEEGLFCEYIIPEAEICYYRQLVD